MIGGAAHDILAPGVAQRFIDAVRARAYVAVVMGIPCTSWSVAHANESPSGAWRSLEHPSGSPDLPEAALRYLRSHDEIAALSVEIALAASESETEVVIENPAPRSRRPFGELSSFWLERSHLPDL